MMLEKSLLSNNGNVDDDDDDNREFVERFERSKALYSLIDFFNK